MVSPCLGPSEPTRGDPCVYMVFLGPILGVLRRVFSFPSQHVQQLHLERPRSSWEFLYTSSPVLGSLCRESKYLGPHEGAHGFWKLPVGAYCIRMFGASSYAVPLNLQTICKTLDPSHDGVEIIM